MNDNLVGMDMAKIDEIRNQLPSKDWSAQPVENATIDDLDEVALFIARRMFKKVHSSIPAEEIDAWTTEEFLKHSGVMIDGKLTRSAVLLLGKPTTELLLSPYVARISWSLRDENKDVVDYEHFTIPYILTVDKVLAKIRNITIRELPSGTLFPDTMKQYDEYSIRELLHNCIAHSDYELCGRINLVENPTFLYYENCGSFIPVTIENVLEADGPQKFYRNPNLVNAMANFNMIDTIGRGIKKVFMEQKRRCFPMPDYVLRGNEVGVRLYGRTIDEKYKVTLKNNQDLSLMECVWLDAIQKHNPVTPLAVKTLRKKRLIKGRSPKFIIS